MLELKATFLCILAWRHNCTKWFINLYWVTNKNGHIGNVTCIWSGEKVIFFNVLEDCYCRNIRYLDKFIVVKSGLIFLCFNIYENVLFCFLLSGDVLTYFQISDSSSSKTEAFLVLFLTKSDYLVFAQLGTMCQWTLCGDHMINSYNGNNTRNASVFTVTQFWTVSQWTVRSMNAVT
jgi:hypothetical protein